jgi:hypothetical protein
MAPAVSAETLNSLTATYPPTHALRSKPLAESFCGRRASRESL